jgi:phenylpropionate dioxygenase-like ring-hydroxylating dioxygenase large terminal subunit
MIRNQWYIVLDSKEVKPGKPLGVNRMGEKLVFWRDSAGKVICMRDLCPHLGARLSQGKLIGDRLRCPFHGFEYDTNGKCRLVPAIGKNGKIPNALEVSNYPVYEAHGWIWIYWGKPQEGELSSPEFFNEIDDRFSYGSFRQYWPVHYSRMVENQLDVMHLPFVHHNTIGAGGKSLVDGPLVKIEDNVLSLWVYNRLDDGTPALRMEEIPEPKREPFLIFIFPNLWENRIGDGTRILIAFVPVDEENGILYGRYYQNQVRVPILKELVNWFGVLGSIVIANQDKRVVSNILPKRTELKKIGQILVPGDRAILMYRTQRSKLKVLAGQDKEFN